MSEVARCPYTQVGGCRLESRYDTTALSDAAVAAIVEQMNDEDADGLVAILEAASGRIYRGESCQRCGAFFPAS